MRACMHSNVATCPRSRSRPRYCCGCGTHDAQRRRANANISPTAFAFGQIPFIVLLYACASGACILHTFVLFSVSLFFSLSLRPPPPLTFFPRRVAVHLYFDTLSRTFIPLLTFHFHAVSEEFPLARNLELGYTVKRFRFPLLLPLFLSSACLSLFLLSLLVLFYPRTR